MVGISGADVVFSSVTIVDAEDVTSLRVVKVPGADGVSVPAGLELGAEEESLPAEVRGSVVDVTTVLSVDNVDEEMEVWGFFEDAVGATVEGAAPEQMTLTSSLCPQLCLPQPAC